MKVPITPAVLHWAITDAGASKRSLAEELGVETSDLQHWLSGTDAPSLTQLRRLASLLRRTPSFFFLPAPPAEDTPSVAFRAAPDRPTQAPSPDARAALRETHGMQQFLAWLTRELQLGTTHLPTVRRASQPHDAASELRSMLGIDTDQRRHWKSADEALRVWRSSLEAQGVSVFLCSIPAGPRGFSISNAWNPVVVVNTHQSNAGARIFTLFHELAHLLRGTDSSCMTIGTSSDEEERWCDRFAAAFLMPWDAVEQELRARHGWDGVSQIDDLDVVRRIAERFRVSMLAAAVRLVTQQVAPRSLISRIPAASNQGKGFGSSDPDKARRPYRRLQRFGRRTAVLLKDAIAKDIVTKHEALSRLGCDFDEFEEIVGLAEAS